MPITIAAAVPTNVAKASAGTKPTPSRTSAAVVIAPSPTKANWPSDSCPAQPVSTVRETATMA